MGVPEFLKVIARVVPGGLSRVPQNSTERIPDQVGRSAIFRDHRPQTCIMFDYVLIDATNVAQSIGFDVLFQFLTKSSLLVHTAIIFAIDSERNRVGSARQNRQTHLLVGDLDVKVVQLCVQLRAYYQRRNTQAAHMNDDENASILNDEKQLQVRCDGLSMSMLPSSVKSHAHGIPPSSPPFSWPAVLMSGRDVAGEADYKILDLQRRIVAWTLAARDATTEQPGAASLSMPSFLIISEDSDVLCGSLCGPYPQNICIATNLHDTTFDLCIMRVSNVLSYVAGCVDAFHREAASTPANSSRAQDKDTTTTASQKQDRAAQKSHSSKNNDHGQPSSASLRAHKTGIDIVPKISHVPQGHAEKDYVRDRQERERYSAKGTPAQVKDNLSHNTHTVSHHAPTQSDDAANTLNMNTIKDHVNSMRTDDSGRRRRVDGPMIATGVRIELTDSSDEDEEQSAAVVPPTTALTEDAQRPSYETVPDTDRAPRQASSAPPSPHSAVAKAALHTYTDVSSAPLTEFDFIAGEIVQRSCVDLVFIFALVMGNGAGVRALLPGVTKVDSLSCWQTYCEKKYSHLVTDADAKLGRTLLDLAGETSTHPSTLPRGADVRETRVCADGQGSVHRDDAEMEKGGIVLDCAFLHAILSSMHYADVQSRTTTPADCVRATTLLSHAVYSTLRYVLGCNIHTGAALQHSFLDSRSLAMMGEEVVGIPSLASVLAVLEQQPVLAFYFPLTGMEKGALVRALQSSTCTRAGQTDAHGDAAMGGGGARAAHTPMDSRMRLDVGESLIAPTVLSSWATRGVVDRRQGQTLTTVLARWAMDARRGACRNDSLAVHADTGLIYDSTGSVHSGRVRGGGGYTPVSPALCADKNGIDIAALVTQYAIRHHLRTGMFRDGGGPHGGIKVTAQNAVTAKRNAPYTSCVQRARGTFAAIVATWRHSLAECVGALEQMHRGGCGNKPNSTSSLVHGEAEAVSGAEHPSTIAAAGVAALTDKNAIPSKDTRTDGPVSRTSISSVDRSRVSEGGLPSSGGAATRYVYSFELRRMTPVWRSSTTITTTAASPDGAGVPIGDTEMSRATAPTHEYCPSATYSGRDDTQSRRARTDRSSPVKDVQSAVLAAAGLSLHYAITPVYRPHSSFASVSSPEAKGEHGNEECAPRGKASKKTKAEKKKRDVSSSSSSIAARRVKKRKRCTHE